MSLATAIIIFVNQALETAIADSPRLIMTGQIFMRSRVSDVRHINS